MGLVIFQANEFFELLGSKR